MPAPLLLAVYVGERGEHFSQPRVQEGHERPARKGEESRQPRLYRRKAIRAQLVMGTSRLFFFRRKKESPAE